MSKWIKCCERQPERYGRYKVIRRVRSGKTEQDEYLWNGGSWVTHKNSLSNAVNSWWEETAAVSGTARTAMHATWTWIPS